MRDRDVLGAVPFFAEVLDDRSLDALAAGAKCVEYDRSATILSENDPGELMFVIVSGAVTVSIHDGGQDRRVATLRDGDIIGEMSLLTGAPRTATVSALRPTVALEIAKPAIAPLLATSPDLAERFAETIERRKAELDGLYGPLHWLRPGVQAGAITEQIRRFFHRPA